MLQDHESPSFIDLIITNSRLRCLPENAIALTARLLNYHTTAISVLQTALSK